MDKRDLYEVEKEYYKTYVNHINNDATFIERTAMDNQMVEVAIVSQKRGVKLCSRLFSLETDEIPERYFIWETLEPDEYKPWTPPRQVTLTSPKQVQALFDYIQKASKKEN